MINLTFRQLKSENPEKVFKILSVQRQYGLTDFNTVWDFCFLKWKHEILDKFPNVNVSDNILYALIYYLIEPTKYTFNFSSLKKPQKLGEHPTAEDKAFVWHVYKLDGHKEEIQQQNLKEVL